MKKQVKQLIFIALHLVLISSYSQSNTQETSEYQNELKLNMSSVIAVAAADITYERVLNAESSIGISGFYLLNNSSDISYYKTFSVTPYYRNYFANYSKGLFLEIFATYYQRKEDLDPNDLTIQGYSNNAALGISFGKKWVTPNKFIIELYAGIGRNFYNDLDLSAPVIGRGGLIVGKGF